MSLVRSRIVFAMLGGFAAAFWGCGAPWTPSARTTQAATSAPAVPQQTDMPGTAIAPQSTADREPDLTGVLDKLQQVRELDPAAEAKLVEQLRHTPSKSWPLVAEQFRASLAYHKKLAAKSPPQPRAGAATTSSAEIETGYDSARKDQANSSVPLSDARPSEPIGTLVDPRSAEDGVSSEALAKATPYASPSAAPQTDQAKVARDVSSAPGVFIAHDAVYPIAAATSATDDKAKSVKAVKLDSAVMQTGFETTNDAAVVPAPTSANKMDWQEHVRRAADDLSRRVAADPATTAEVHQHASLRMLWLLAGETEKALEPIPHVSPTEQDYWSRQLFTLATYLDHHTQPDDKRRAAASVTHLDEAMASLRELGSLSLTNLTFCKNVYGYGSIDPFGTDRFTPGQHISLYVEVENYHSKSTEKGYCTLLGSTYEILDDQGKRITGGEFPDVDDCCRSRRRDFHIQYGLTMPEEIAAGTYQLQLVVKDRQSEKIGHAMASFEIRGKTTSPLVPLSAATITK
jgi:hypothetical protein